MKYWLTKDMTTLSGIKCLEEFFNFFGHPVKIVSDGGPCFKSEYLQGRHVMHHFTSAYHPSNNGLVERDARSLKVIHKKVKGPLTKQLL